jgi:hypothetical protein
MPRDHKTNGRKSVGDDGDLAEAVYSVFAMISEVIFSVTSKVNQPICR